MMIPLKHILKRFLRWQSYKETCMIHGQTPNRCAFYTKMLKASINKKVKNVLPTSLRRKLTRLPNGNMPILPIESFKQLKKCMCYKATQYESLSN